MKITELIPQRDPVVLVGKLIAVKDRSATSEFLVEEDNLFVQDGLLRESGLIENIAQTAAAMNGYIARSEGSPVKQGFIGGIKDLQIKSLPRAGSILTTEVKEEHFVMNTSIVKGEIRINNRLIASCEMKVVILE